MIDVYSPLRIDLFGNWSDHINFLNHRPSRVVNTAFCLAPDRFPVHVRVTKLKQPIVCHRSLDLKKTRFLSYEDIVITPVLNGLLEYYDISTSYEFEMALREKGGIEVITSSNVPLRSGLGTSSAMTVSLIMALWTLESRKFDIGELANHAYVVERRTSQCGWQDHYASVYGQPILIERHSSLCNPSITVLPQSFSVLLEQYGLLIFVSERQHPEVKWDVEGNEDILYAMDDLINDFLTMLPVMNLDLLQELIRLTTRISRRFFPHEFCERLDSILNLVRPLDCCGFLTGLGPAAVLLSPEPDAVRNILDREQVHSYHIYPAPSGAVAFQNSSYEDRKK